ncbi:hypothetical protein KGM_203560 [Danaus plexippus plexippus]|uniref:Uncharacterized protein n=1 Tax=Danaus plexippus plexippus TaxID=278856 RepID=A0A212EL89_DANPL|nr:hypothetical protein KGM_203560 [Danaus plexippus plexippus]
MRCGRRLVCRLGNNAGRLAQDAQCDKRGVCGKSLLGQSKPLFELLPSLVLKGSHMNRTRFNQMTGVSRVESLESCGLQLLQDPRGARPSKRTN